MGSKKDRNEGNIKEEKAYVASDDEGLDAIVKRNRKPLIIAAVSVVVIIAGVSVGLGVHDTMAKARISELEQFLARYADLKPRLDEAYAEAAASTEAAISADLEKEAQTLLTESQALGKRASGYAGAKAWAIAADILMERGEWEEAEAACLESAAKGKRLFIAPVALFNAGVAAEEAGDTDAAIAHYTASLDYKDFPSAAHSQFSIGRLNETKGEREAALAAYRNVINNWPNDTNWANLAQSRLIALEAGL